jgi:hypothetical protein
VCQRGPQASTRHGRNANFRPDVYGKSIILRLLYTVRYRIRRKSRSLKYPLGYPIAGEGPAAVWRRRLDAAFFTSLIHYVVAGTYTRYSYGFRPHEAMLPRAPCGGTHRSGHIAYMRPRAHRTVSIGVHSAARLTTSTCTHLANRSHIAVTLQLPSSASRITSRNQENSVSIPAQMA